MEMILSWFVQFDIQWLRKYLLTLFRNLSLNKKFQAQIKSSGKYKFIYSV